MSDVPALDPATVEACARAIEAFRRDSPETVESAGLRFKLAAQIRALSPQAGGGARCYDCGLAYDDPGFQDLLVSNEVWAKISPTGHEGGLLCPSCMCRRAHAAGLSNVAASFMSGPFYATPSPAAVPDNVRNHLAEVCARTRFNNSDAIVTRLDRRIVDAVLEALSTAPQAPGKVDGWFDGAPPKPWSEEWFIAETTYGDRVVLKALPDEYTYDFKTADETYIKRDKIKRWMQFPDSDYIQHPAPGTSPVVPAPSTSPAAETDVVERLAAAVHDVMTVGGVGYVDSAERIKVGWRENARKVIAASGLLASSAGVSHDWTEDFGHENGQYLNSCCQCGREFKGHKRRATCKNCPVSELARVVHVARFPNDRKPTPFDEETQDGRSYCFRIARAVYLTGLAKHIHSPDSAGVKQDWMRRAADEIYSCEGAPDHQSHEAYVGWILDIISRHAPSLDKEIVEALERASERLEGLFMTLDALDVADRNNLGTASEEVSAALEKLRGR